MADVIINKYTTQVVREGSTPASPGFVVSEGQDPVNPPGTNNFVPYSGAISNVDLGEFGLDTGFVRLDTSPTGTPTDQGTIYWDASKSTAALIMNGTLQHIGQDSFFYVKNSTGSSIPKGTAVRFDGTDGASGHLKIAPFLANGTYPSSYFMGVTAEAIANGGFGQVMHFGELNGINTSGYTAGALLYALTTVAGAFQTTVPVAPNNIVLIAAAVNSKNNGEIVVRPQIGSNINNDEGVKITSGTTGDLLQLQAGGLWENKTVAQVIGSAYVPSTRTITINGTALDLSANRSWTVGDVRTDGSYSNPSWITSLAWSKISGTPTTLSGYGITDAVPSARTITINGTTLDLSANRTFNVGTVTSVTATSPLFSSGGATPNITIQQSSGSQSGFLSSTDWNTFNNKQNALTNPVTGTGTTNYLPKFTGASTIGNSQVFDNGTGVGIGTASPLTKLMVQDSANTYVAHFSGLNQANGIAIGTNSSNIAVIQGYTRTFSATNNIAMQADGGNVLIGTTTDSGFKLDVNGTGRFNGNLSTGTGASFTTWSTSGNVDLNDVYLSLSSSGSFGGAISNNAYFNSGWKYKAANNATLYQTLGGEHRFFTAGVGAAAGNAISFTQALTITSSGNVGIGTSSPSFQLHINRAGNTGVFVSNTTGNTGGYLYAGGLSGLELQSVDSSNSTAQKLMLQPYGGNVGIGTSSPNRLLTVSGTEGLIALNATSYRNTTIGSDSVGNFIVYDDTAAAYRMVIKDSGNVGIGTISPTTYSLAGRHLELNDAGGGYSFIHNNTTSVKSFYASNESAGVSVLYTFSNHPLLFGTNNTERFRISSTGFVSAGATTNGRLGVRGFTNDSSGYSFEAANASGNTLFIVRNDGISTFTNNVGIGTYSPATPLHIVTATGVNFQNAIRLEKAGGYGEVNLENYYTSGSNYGFGIDVAGTTMMVVNSSGNVGIGTTSPTTKLDVRGLVASIAGSGSNGLLFGDYGSDAGTFLISAISGRNIVIRDEFAGAERMRITSGGNVLIGTTTDVGARLHVNGGIRTGAPSGGSAVDWKLGTARAGTITPNATVRVEINGVLVDLDARYV